MDRYSLVIMLIRTVVFLLITFYSFKCPKILLHIFTAEKLIFKWSVVLGSQVIFFWLYFPFKFCLVYGASLVVRDGRNLKFC